MIPEAAVTAAAKALYADKMSNHSGDNAPQIIDACEKVARKILEAAAPFIAADAWDAATADKLETKLAAIIVALDPLERATDWTAKSDEAGCPAFNAVLKIRAILDAE